MNTTKEDEMATEFDLSEDSEDKHETEKTIDESVDSFKCLDTNTTIARLRLMNSWRRAEPPYDKAGAQMPLTPTQYGQAIDSAVYFLSNIKA